jgi:predicted MPP superfamily phosphohydrolase
MPYRAIRVRAILGITIALLSGCSLNPASPAGPAAVQAPAAARAAVPLPNLERSLKLAVIGDFGSGSRAQYEMAAQMAKTHATFPFEIVLLTGDNIYGSERPQDFVAKFEEPYKPLLEKDVKFYASLGNHDSREQRFYKPFNMEGKLYYSFKAPAENVRFFAFESSYMDPNQVKWIEAELKGSNDEWKIAYLHHPLYSSGQRHGSDLRLREAIESLLIKYNVSVVFAGHDHFYERIKPQHGIVHFVVGSGGQLRRGNITRRSPITAQGFDTDLAFFVAEIVGDEMTFRAISRTGQVVDSGTITRRLPAEAERTSDATF